MERLTEKQQKILDFIVHFRARNGVSPSVREIQLYCRYASPKAVQDHLSALVRKGYVENRGKSRGVLPVHEPENEIPLLGKIAAGAPIAALENIETTFDLSGLGLDNSRHDYFALRVVGDSMINANIQDGDTVVVKKQDTVSAREIAAIYWEGSATIKYLRKKGRKYLLLPANARMAPLEIVPDAASDFRILGKVVLSFRRH